MKKQPKANPLAQHWAALAKEIEAGSYQGGTPGRPAFNGFSQEDILAYCRKMETQCRQT